MRNIKGYQPTDKLDTSNPPNNKLVLFDVIQRSEQLIDFFKWLNDYEKLEYTEKGIRFYVDEYLKSINCV